MPLTWFYWQYAYVSGDCVYQLHKPSSGVPDSLLYQSSLPSIAGSVQRWWWLFQRGYRPDGGSWRRKVYE